MTADKYCVMGNPVAHSQSPWIHARFAELTGQHVDYGRREIPLDGFAQGVRAWQAEGGRGCNITVPFKFEAAAVAQHMSDRGQLAQACNVLTFTEEGVQADNTDGIGLVRDIRDHAGVNLRDKSLLLLGAGGAASGVLGPLIEAGCARIVVANRTLSRAQALVQRHLPLAQAHGVALSAAALAPLAQDQHGGAAARTFDVVINATASSLAGAGVPVHASVMKPGALALDMMYGPGAQEFLGWARAHGAVARDGLGMLVEQAAEAFLIWRGVRPPSAQVLAELRLRLEGGKP